MIQHTHKVSTPPTPILPQCGAAGGAHLGEAEEEPHPAQDLQHLVGVVQHHVPALRAAGLLTGLSGGHNKNLFSIQGSGVKRCIAMAIQSLHTCPFKEK